MIDRLFSVPILRDNYPLTEEQIEKIKNIVYPQFSSHELEIGDAHSTSDSARNLHTLPEFSDISEYILTKADEYWLDYGLSNRYEPTINETWINRHGKGGVTDTHHHSGAPVVAAYYIQFESGNGDITFVNPLEYHQCHEPRERTCGNMTANIKQFDLLIFPGMLNHKTGINHLDNDRIVMSFNFGFKDREPKRYYFE